ncbi:MAG: fasciclin domain-containing protein [Bacteroidia bacterium]|nr:fasciclin domain-containing protein [Bacteroidia bacterium]
MKTNLKFILVILLAVSTLFAGCEKEEEMVQMDEKNIVEVAQSAGQFNVLLQAAVKAGLADFLSTENNLTVFAPTDAAFAALLKDLGLTSLDQIDAATLGNILKYHVVSGVVYSKDLKSGYVPTLSTFSGNSISMYVNVEEGVTINKNTKVTTADIKAKNGVVHVVDKVILPPTVVSVALANSNFTTLVQAVVKAGLVDALNGAGPFTVFAPTNDAFSALFTQLGITGINDLTAEQLVPILTYHVVSGNVLSTNLTAGEVGTLNGKKISVNLTGGVKINNSTVVAADIQGSNGVVHVINQVLIP